MRNNPHWSIGGRLESTLAEVQLCFACLKMHVVDKQKAVFPGHVCIAIDFIFPRVAQDVTPPQEQRLILSHQCSQIGKKFDIPVIEQVAVSPKLGKDKV